jgi:hypothetical protein
MFVVKSVFLPSLTLLMSHTVCLNLGLLMYSLNAFGSNRPIVNGLYSRLAYRSVI